MTVAARKHPSKRYAAAAGRLRKEGSRLAMSDQNHGQEAAPDPNLPNAPADA